MVVNAGMNADIRSSVSANVVLVGAELAALSRDALQLLLRRSVGVANLHQHALISNRGAVKLLDHILALITGLEAALKVRR